MFARDILRWIRGLAALAAGLTAALSFADDTAAPQARYHVDGFDGERPTWEVTSETPSNVRVLAHARSQDVRHAGERSELLDIESRARLTNLEFEQKLPAARIIDELTLSVWVYATQDGLSFSARGVLPNQKDPQTGQPMVVTFPGSKYVKPGQWTQLTCENLRTQLTSMLPRLREQLRQAGQRPQIDDRGAYIDAAFVAVQMDRGRSRFAIDDLRFGPLVEAAAAREVQQVSATESKPAVDARIDLGRLYVKGQPFFPRIVPYHDERPEDLARIRLNLVSIPDSLNTRLLGELNEAGLRAMAVPPQPPLDPGRAQMTPFGSETAPILLWYLGTRVPPEKKRSLMQWKEQIENADQEFSRPVTADVAGLERDFSRQIPLFSISRAVLQSSFGMMPYRDWLIERRMQATPGSLLWTWIATEPALPVARQRQAAGWSPIVVEPEQLRLETYAALAAGCRGLGFWTQTPLDGDGPGAVERRLMLTQLSMEIELLEAQLSTGRVHGQTPFKVQLPTARKVGQLDVPSGTDAKSETQRKQSLTNRSTQRETREQAPRELEAAVIHSDAGTLVLPVWYAADAAFVPGQMVANKATIVVPIGDAVKAYEISTTKITSLDSKRVTGGREVILEKFDMTSVILFTDDMALVERLHEKVRGLAETSARVCLELARAKLERVTDVERRIREFGFAQVDAPQLLGRARAHLELAEARWQQRQFHESRDESGNCLQTLRILQHACWTDAVGRIRNRSAVSSPHTLCFQTLPDHWDMVARHGRARHAGGRNLLRSGDFEDFDTMVAEGWKHDQVEIKGVRAVGELYPQAHKGSYCLRLIATAATGEDPPTVISERPVTVTTPPMQVHKGEIVYITGWAKVAAPSLKNLDGAMLYDNLQGPSTALRWRNKSDWQQFELMREVTETTDLTLTVTLSGLGEIRFDDLQVIPLAADVSPESPGTKSPPINRTNQKGGALDFFKKIPRFGPKAEGE